MAYAEKRGKGPQPWRVKYKLPDGTEASESGFETKAAALTWGRDQEARIREGSWTNPNASKLTVGEWIDRWLAVQDVGISTIDNHHYVIRRFLRPAWATSPLDSLTTEDITRWRRACPPGPGSPSGPPAACWGPSSATGHHQTVADRVQPRAAATQPRPPAVCPAARLGHTLQALLLAERAALLSGRGDDFTMLITIAYAGLRCAWAIGLEHFCLVSRNMETASAARP